MKTKDLRSKTPRVQYADWLLQNENEKAVSINQSRNQSATWVTSVPNGDMVGNGDINSVTPLS